jgi:thiol-disulfide isomerase/thioredoxin
MRIILIVFLTLAQLVSDVVAQEIDSSNYFIYQEITRDIKPGHPALKMAYQNSNGEVITMNDLKGKVVFLDFWASYCAYCVSQIPELTKLQEKYPEIAVVRVSVDERESAWRKATEKHAIKGYNLWAKGMTAPASTYTLDMFYFEASEANGLPATFELSNPIPGYVLIDQSGNLVANWAPEPGTLELDKMITDLLR